MINSNTKKQNVLGMPYGTANARLKKSLLYEFAKRLDLCNCFQCGKLISNIKEFSIEHKVPWLNSHNPIETFYDINNIAFSHIKCNIKASNKPHKKYKDKAENKREGFRRYYANPENKEKFLERKRTRYHNNKVILE